MNAITRRAVVQSPRVGTEVNEDGSMLITEDQLKRFGNGDAKVGRRELRLLLAMDRDGPVLSGPTERPASVRMATPEDEDALLALWLQDLRENAEAIAPIDAEKVLENIRAGTRKRGGIVACIEGPDSRPVAMLVLLPLEWHWSRGRFWQEMTLYVHPDHRQSRHVQDLIAFSKWCSDRMSKDMGSRFYLLCGVLGTWRVRAKIALYRRQVQQVGSVHCYPAPPLKEK